MKYFIHLAYKGTRYHGWQRQPGHPSIQETLEDRLEKMLGYRVNCIGCGRTDTGVHASQYFCHIKLEEAPSFDPVFRLNKMLPDDISVFDFLTVPFGAHAQHDATARSYTYRIHLKKNAFLSELSTFYPPEGLDISKLKSATELLTGYNDFRAFCKQPHLYKTTVCDLSAASLTIAADGESMRIDLTADRFLRGMVRLLVGNLLEVGYGRLEFGNFVNSLESGLPLPYFNAAYPQGLYLSAVQYPFLECPPLPAFTIQG